ncbi:ABC transporter substrate-binding protein [uncultured Anaerococcus sp.]|uniref:ABC transporter substrate-binding protein n=1 Tax=uncultured Anaerococcus sp. TaxID=293428 RepID=UPI0026378A53|nr:ABC transporter substrate-binding protein [uncultured Anaerococcus sp.]
MKAIKKIFYALSINAFLLAGLSGCNKGEEKQTSQIEEKTEVKEEASEIKSEEPKGEELSEDSETRTITDHAGNEVVLPKEIKRVVIDQVPILSTYMAYHGGEAPYIVGYAGSLKQVAEKTVLKDIAPELMDADETVHGQSDLNIEEIVKLKPDVIFYNATNKDRYEALSKSGIPCVGFATIGTLGQADPIDRYGQWLKLLEDVFGEEGKTDDFLAAGEKIVKDVEERIATVDQKDRPNGMILWKYNEGVPMVAGKGTFGDFWLKRIGVSNVFEDAKGYAKVNVEEIYKQDPQVLYLDGPGLLNMTTSDVFENKVEGFDFSNMDAVKNKRVYNSKLGMWNWLTPNPDAPLVYAWLANVTFPEAFDDYDLKGEIKDYYKTWYKYDLTDDQVDDMFDI